MFTNNWIQLTRRTKLYRLKVRLGWLGWLLELQRAISPKELWTFIMSYWQEFVEIVRSIYGIDLETATDDELAMFFYKTGLFYIEKKDDNVKLTKNQVNYAYGLMRFYARQILEWLKQGDIYASENVY